MSEKIPTVAKDGSDQHEQLAEIVMGLAAVDGYSGGDLTNPRKAALRGEVLYLPRGAATAAAPPLELRVHGVGGAPPADNLETPNTLQVAGDDSAGFYRPWHPGGSPHADEPRREAYCWGKLNVGSWTRALWLMLVAFMIVNVAYFALPPRGTAALSRAVHYLSRAVLRLVALAITVAFIGTAITVLADITAYQGGTCPAKPTLPCKDALPTWMGSYGSLGVGPRLALAFLAVLAVLLVLWRLSARTAKDYEAWRAHGTERPEPEPAPDQAVLSHPRFWRGERTVARQRSCHVIAGAAEVVFLAAMPHAAVGAARWALLGIAIALGAAAVALLCSPWADRDHSNRHDEAFASDHAVTAAAWGAVLLAGGTSVSRFWWQPTEAEHALPGNHPLQSFVVITLFGLLGVLFVLSLVLRPWRDADGERADVLAGGLAGWLLATLATVIATIFGAAFTLTVANLMGKTPRYCAENVQCSPNSLYLPQTVYAGGAGMVGAVVVVVLIGIGLWSSRRRLARRYASPGPDGVVEHYLDRYPGALADDPTLQSRFRDDHAEAIAGVAGTWATSKLTDLAGTVLFWLAVPTAAGIAWFLFDLVVGGRPSFQWSIGLATFGGTIGVLAVGYFLLQLRAAITNAASRKRFGFILDVGTFFPRACAPFGPPCYAERSVPEIVSRIRRVVGDEVRGADDPAAAMQAAERAGLADDDPVEAHSGVVLVGYSQGTPISVAAVAQLPDEVVQHVGLLLFAAPVRRLYARAFPAYFGRRQLETIRGRLTPADGVPRWRALVRRSDYIGGWVFASPTEHGSDRYVYDPPVLWPDADPTAPPTHRHSDWFPDPQTRPHVEQIAALIPPVQRELTPRPPTRREAPAPPPAPRPG